MVRFEYMKKDEFPEYWKYSVESWKYDMQKAGFIGEGMTYEEAEEQVRKFLPTGAETPGHYLMHIFKGRERVGDIWFEIRERGLKDAYLWDIVIYDGNRGKGYGKESMKELEGFVKKEGAKRISLNVFGFNQVALNLYRTSGYHDAAITMMKYL